jgi:methyl-CpG-binding domain protein 4
VPPPSPYGLLQEAVFYDPWRVLVVCVLLNKTTCLQVRTVVSQLFVICPTAEAAALADVESIRRVIAPLGLVKRAEGIISLSAAYLTTSWVRVTELPFVGKYASDAYALFCSGAWRDVEPDDKELVRYHAFLRDTDGLGRGYEREELQ